MRIAIVADYYLPLSNSAAVQLSDLAAEIIHQGHTPIVIVPNDKAGDTWLDEVNGVHVLRVKVPLNKGTSYLRRTISEAIMPFAMIWAWRQSSLKSKPLDGVVWYSPSIFHGRFVAYIKKQYTCRSYLILRDIFPEWAADIGLLSRKGLPFRIFKRIEHFQYSIADTIGVQSEGNLPYLANWSTQHPHRYLEILHNWLTPSECTGCSVDLSQTIIAGRRTFVYAGNVGVAQGPDIIIALAELLSDRNDIGFAIVGRGSGMDHMRERIKTLKLTNIVTFDEIPSAEIPSLFEQCSFGLLALNPAHKTHNIPGKFLAYMYNGLPVLASVNLGNDIAEIIETNQLGQVSVDGTIETFHKKALALIETAPLDKDAAHRCVSFAYKSFSPKTAVSQIISALSTKT